MSGQIRLTGTITIPENRQAELVPLLHEHTRLTRAEPGCIEFEARQDDTRHDIFHVRELFDNQEAFDKHQIRGSASAWGKASLGLPRDFTKTLIE